MSTYLKKCWKITALVCLLQIAAWGMQTAVQYLLIGLFDAAISLDFERVKLWMLLDIGGWLVYIFLETVESWAQARTVRRLNNEVRSDLYRTLWSKSPQEYHAQGTGEYLSWLTNDIKQMETLAWTPFFECVGRVMQVVSSIVVLYTLHWSLVVFALVAAGVMLSIPQIFTKRMQKLGKECSENQALAVSRLKDLLGGVDVLRFFGRGELFRQQGEEISDEIEVPNCRLSSGKATTSGMSGLVNVTFQITSIFLVVLLALQGKVAVAILSGGVNLVGNVTNGLSNLMDLRVSLASAKPYFEKINAHTDMQAQTSAPLPEMKQDITVEHLNFTYGDKPILRNADFTFEKGKKYALTGPSGCGKSTLLKLILGWLPNYTGTIRMDGEDVRNYTPEQLQQQMSYIEQNVFLFNTTIRENITLGETFSDEAMQKALRESALIGDLANMPDGLDTVVGEEGSRLSGGQKQRVAIARALIHGRSILLVDEGTSALDQKNADIVETSLLQNPDLTLLLVSHHLTDQRRKQFDKVFELKTA